MTERRLWIRLGLFAVAFPNVVNGVWMLVDPIGWYRGFPGLGRHWASVFGPFNHHLVVDAGAGFLAIGVLVVIALVWARREVIIAALAAALVHALPHFLYHVTHRPAGLGASDAVMSAASLGLVIGAAVICLIAVTSSRSVEDDSMRIGERVTT